MYDEPAFIPTTAETVIVHAIFGNMLFEFAARNGENREQQARLTQQSNLHYHYALGMFHELVRSHTVHDVQALAVLCLHVRCFPKPGASWILTQLTISLAIELGMHRSTTRLPDQTNVLEIEMRKRTFYSLLAMHITIAGKLGRPMILRLEDFDVEMPEPIDDELLTTHGMLSKPPGKCLHVNGLCVYSMSLLYLEMYNHVYVARRNADSYIATVNTLEGKLHAWKESLPPELTDAEGTDQETRVFAWFARFWELEFRLLLRHPSVSMTSDPAYHAQSMRICVESARQMLGIVRQLQKYKSLDTTWTTSAIYVMAITTTLFAQWEKRDTTTPADLAALREEVDLWLDILGDVGRLLGRLPGISRTPTNMLRFW